MNNNLKFTKKFIYIFTLVFVVLFSVGYSALSSTLGIGGSTRYNKKEEVRITGINLAATTEGGTEMFSPSYTKNTTTTGVNLPNSNSTVMYSVTVRNYGSKPKGISFAITSNSNANITYQSQSNISTIPAGTTVSFTILIQYVDPDPLMIPSDTTDTMTITYTFGNAGAMFDTGQVVNTKMKQFVNSSAAYSSIDTTITNIARYTDIPNPTYLTDTYKVSVDEYMTPIYMWYDSTNTTIYWYSEATNVYYNPDSSSFFYNLRAINSISCINDISSEYVTNMSRMFYSTGYNSTTFTLDLGDKFDTSNVTNMFQMFYSTGYNSTTFTLGLGDKFDTSNVTSMYRMFSQTGWSSTTFTLDLGDKFDTSNVTTMAYMFFYTGRISPVFTLDLGDKFDTSNVTDMSSMFYSTGYSSTVFTLDLGNLFDTSNVTDMSSMFGSTGHESTVFTLDLGNLFDTSNVTNMQSMFSYTGYSSTIYTLDLGNLFDTSQVTSMNNMFYSTGYSSTVFTLDLGDKFDTSNVTNMFSMFSLTGLSSPVFTLDLGDKFDTSNVTNMQAMFGSTGYSSPVFTLNLGSKFDTCNVTDMSGMFSHTGYSSTVFTLDLGDKFDTSNVTNMQEMFSLTGYSSTVFTLDLGDKFYTSNVTNMFSMFSYTGYSNTSFTLDLGDKFDTSNVTNLSYMFRETGYNSTTFALDLGDLFDTSNVTNMSWMFYSTGYSNTSFTLDLGDKFDTSNVTNLSYMFSNSRYLKTIYAPTTFVTTSVTSSNNMFAGCTSLVGGAGTAYNSSNPRDKTYAHIDGGTANPGYFTDRNIPSTIYWGYSSLDKNLTLSGSSLTRIVTESGTTTGVFSQASDAPWYSHASEITTINIESDFNPSSMAYFFSNLTALRTINDFDLVNTSRVTSFERMFNGNGLLVGVDLSNMNTSKATNMSGMFNECLRLKYADLTSFDTSKVTNMSNMFSNTSLKTIYASNNFVTTAVTNGTDIFTNSVLLTGGAGTIDDGGNLGYAHIDGGTANPGYFTSGPVQYSSVIIDVVTVTSYIPKRNCTDSELSLFSLSGTYNCYSLPLNQELPLVVFSRTGTSTDCVNEYDSRIRQVGEDTTEHFTIPAFYPTKANHYLLNFVTKLCNDPQNGNNS